MRTTQFLFGIVVLSLTLWNQAAAQTFLTNGLVGWYPFNDGNANDRSGNSNNTIVYGAKPANDRFGWPSNAYVFSNRGDSISTTNWVGFPVSTNDFTVSFWVNVVSANTYSPLIRQSGGQFDFNLGEPTGGTTIFFFNTGSGGAARTPLIPWSFQQWYNLQVVRSQNTNITIYQDGVQVSHQTTTLGNDAPEALRNLTFGYYASAGGTFQLHGSLDDIRIYNRALSPNELHQLYEYESGPRIGLVKAVKPVFDNLSFGTIYQLQVSSDLNVWTNSGAPFTATNKSMIYPQYWDVDNWTQLSFRLQISQ